MLFATRKRQSSESSENSNAEDGSRPDRKARKKSKKRREKNDVPRRKRNTAQAVIQYEAMVENGVCSLGGNQYSVTLKLADIDYQLAPEEEQASLVESYAQFVNSFDAGQSIQLTVMNRQLNKAELAQSVEFAPRGDGLDAYRWEYNDLINARLASGRNNTVTEKYVTITVEADDFEHATNKLAQISSDAIAQLRAVGGCRAERVSGEDRIRILHDILRPGEPFRFEYTDLIGTNLTTKDIVSPWAIDFSGDANST